MRNKGYVAPVLGNGQQGGGDLLAGLVLVMENAVVAVGALTGVVKVAVFFGVKVRTQFNQRADHIRRTFDHDPHRLRVVLIMTSLHGVFIKALKVVQTLQHAYAALGQVRVALFQILFGDH